MLMPAKLTLHYSHAHAVVVHAEKNEVLVGLLNRAGRPVEIHNRESRERRCFLVGYLLVIVLSSVIRHEWLRFRRPSQDSQKDSAPFSFCAEVLCGGVHQPCCPSKADRNQGGKDDRWGKEILPAQNQGDNLNRAKDPP